MKADSRKTSGQQHPWTAIAHPGLEPVVARELEERGIQNQIEPGSVLFSAPLEAGAELATTMRTPDRVLLRVGAGTARNLDELSRLVRQLDWSPYLMRDSQVEVHVTSQTSRLRHREAIGKKIRMALRDAVRSHRVPSGIRVPRIPQRLQARIVQDHVTLSLDTSGEHLHRRGWRQERVRAPLRENLAAALLHISGWNGDEALADPFCGSGTLPIEAALIAQERAPFSQNRVFACFAWPALSRWSPPKNRSSPVSLPILGTDHDPKALLAAEGNAKRAKVQVDWRLLDVSELTAPAPLGLVVANPPYGKRIGQHVNGVYTTFGRTLRTEFEGWRAIFLAPSDALAARVDSDAVELTRFSNGGLTVGVFAIENVGN